MCQYEKIREDIIKEREEAMVKYNFYEQPYQTKTKIGFYSKETTKIVRTDNELQKLKGRKESI